MTKKQQIAFYKRQLSDAENLKSCGRQIIAQATQIESAAKSALATLGAKPERAREGNILSDEVKNRIIGSLTPAEA